MKPRGKPFEKGHAKMGGREKGTHDKRTMLVRDILEHNGINLIDEITRLIPLLDIKDQVAALTALVPYVYPKLTSTEIKSEGQGFQIIVQEYKLLPTSAKPVLIEGPPDIDTILNHD